MKNLAAVLDEYEDVEKGEPLDILLLPDYNKLLSLQKLPLVPDKWLALLKEFNGLWHDGAAILAVAPDGSVFGDILEYSLHDAPIPGVLVLGYDEFEYLLYDETVHKYQFYDKAEGNITYQTAEAEAAAARLLKI